MGQRAEKVKISFIIFPLSLREKWKQASHYHLREFRKGSSGLINLSLHNISIVFSKYSNVVIIWFALEVNIILCMCNWLYIVVFWSSYCYSVLFLVVQFWFSSLIYASLQITYLVKISILLRSIIFISYIFFAYFYLFL